MGGLQWPFQNLGAGRETKLAREFPLHVVTVWLGNTPPVALKHDLRVTDEDFARACVWVPFPGVAKALQIRTRPAHALNCTQLPATTKARDGQELMRNRAILFEFRMRD